MDSGVVAEACNGRVIGYEVGTICKEEVKDIIATGWLFNYLTESCIVECVYKRLIYVEWIVSTYDFRFSQLMSGRLKSPPTQKVAVLNLDFISKISLVFNLTVSRLESVGR